MNKSELIGKIAELADTKKTDTAKMLDAFIEAVSDSLKADENVTLIGFGTFKTVQRKAREGRNPATGKKMHVPACRVAKFVPGKALKEKVK